MYNNCQVCGNSIFSANDYGTESNGQRNRDFCSNCYKGGHFYTHDWRSVEDGPLPSHPEVYAFTPSLHNSMYPNGNPMGWF
jgi:hypothetical protein